MNVLMDQAGDGSGGGSGSGSAGAAGGDKGAGAAGAAGGAAGAGAAGGAAGGSGAPAPAWHGLTEKADLDYVANKGWQSPADLYKSYRGAETLIGKDPSTLLVLPRADDAAGQRAVFAKLGMPETADKYDLPLPQGVDPTYANWAKATFHELGLTANQAKALAEKNNAFVAKQTADADAAYKANVTLEKQALLAEWRGGYERQMNSAQTAVRALGLSAEAVTALEGVMGYAGVMKYLAGLGAKLGEDTFHADAGGGKGGFGDTLTPAEAQAQWNEFKSNPANIAALRDNTHPGHEAAKAKQNAWFKIMYPE